MYVYWFASIIAFVFPSILLTSVFATSELSEDEETIILGSKPRAIAVNPDTGTLYVTNFGSNTVSVINTSANTLMENIPVGNGPQGIAINTATNTAYVANSGSDSVSVINTTANTVMENITVGDVPRAIAVNPDTNIVYVASYKPSPSPLFSVFPRSFEENNNPLFWILGIGSRQ